MTMDIPEKLRKKGKYWTHGVNLVQGCTRVSPGCDNCWALAAAERFGTDPDCVRFREDRLHRFDVGGIPKVFSIWDDLFHDGVAFEKILSFMGHVIAAPWHEFMVLTKRPGRMCEFFEWWMKESTRCGYLDLQIGMAIDVLGAIDLRAANEWYLMYCDQSDRGRCDSPVPWPIPHLWMGVTAENQEWAYKRIQPLLKTRTARRFVSLEPLLGPVDLSAFLTYLHWVVVGCETGPQKRACDLEWIRDVVERCQDHAVPVWVKAVNIEGRVVRDFDELPEAVRVREVPQ